MSNTQYSRSINLRIDADDMGALTRAVMYCISTVSTALNSGPETAWLGADDLRAELRRLRSLLDRLENAQ